MFLRAPYKLQSTEKLQRLILGCHAVLLQVPPLPITPIHSGPSNTQRTQS